MKKIQIRWTAYPETAGNQEEKFLQANGEIFVFFNTWDPLDLSASAGKLKDDAPDFNAYLRIDENGMVSGFTGKIEMGQGPITSLAQELADELDVAMSRGQSGNGRYRLLPLNDGTWVPCRRRISAKLSVLPPRPGRFCCSWLRKIQVPVAQLQVHEG
jgi:hypothetical protein